MNDDRCKKTIKPETFDSEIELVQNEMLFSENKECASSASNSDVRYLMKEATSHVFDASSRTNNEIEEDIDE